MKPHDVNPAPKTSPRRPIQSHVTGAVTLLDRALCLRILGPLSDGQRLRIPSTARIQGAP